MHNTDQGALSDSPTEQDTTATDEASPPVEAASEGAPEAPLVEQMAKAAKGEPKTADAKADKGNGKQTKPDAKAEKKVDGAEVPGEQKEDDEKPWPAKAAKARLGKEVAKRKQAEEKLHETRGEVARLQAAMKLAQEELEHYRAQVQMDPRDEQLRSYQLSQKAQQEAQRIAQEQHAAMQEQLQEMQVAELREQLAEEIDGALSQYGKLVHRIELVEAMKADPNVTAEAAAKAIFDAKIQAARPHFMRQPPPTPRTVRAGAAGNTRREYPLNADGMLQRAMELAAENR
jgi:hypothetical protein